MTDETDVQNDALMSNDAIENIILQLMLIDDVDLTYNIFFTQNIADFEKRVIQKQSILTLNCDSFYFRHHIKFHIDSAIVQR